MKLPTPLNQADGSHWKGGLTWLGWTLGAGLLPVWGGALVLVVLSADVTGGRFVDHGQFALYAAGLLATSLYLTLSEISVPRRARPVWGGLSGLLLAAAALTFAAVLASEALPGLAANLNRALLGMISVGLYLIALLIAFLLTVAKESFVDIQNIESSRSAQLEDQFDRLRP